MGHVGAAEVLALFVERTTETGGLVKVPKAAHRIGALLDAAMIVLDPIVHIRLQRWVTSSPSLSEMAREYVSRLSVVTRSGACPATRCGGGTYGQTTSVQRPYCASH